MANKDHKVNVFKICFLVIIINFFLIYNVLSNESGLYQVIELANGSSIIVENTPTNSFGISSDRQRNAFLAPSALNENFPISTANENQIAAYVAYNSKNNDYLVVWVDSRNKSTSGRDIYAQLVSATGELKGNEIIVSNAPGDQTSAMCIAYNSIDNEYLLVYGDVPSKSIICQRISSTGDLIGNKSVISSVSRLLGSDPYYVPMQSIAYNSKDNNYLVVWFDGISRELYNIYGQIISKDGSLKGDKLSICTENNSQANPSVVYNSVNNEYLVVWDDERNTVGSTIQIDIYGRRISNTGNLIGISDFPISPTTSEWEQGPSVAYDSNKNRYLVIWEQGKTYSTTDLYGRFISATGTADSSVFSISTATDYQYIINVVFNYKDKEYLAVWSDYRGPNFDIYGQRISDTGQLKEENFAISNAGGNQVGSKTVYNDIENCYFVVWNDYRNGATSDIYASIISYVSFDLQVSPKSLLADGKSTAVITITLKDSSGKPITGQTVQIKVTKGQGTISSVKDNNDGTYTATYTSSTQPGTETITATVLNKSKTVDITLKDIANFVVEAKPNSLIADGKSTSVITVTLKDDLNNPITGQTVQIEVTKGQGTISSVKDNNDGTYTATYTSSTQPGTETITATVLNKSKTVDIKLKEYVTRKLSIPDVVGTPGGDVTVTIDIDDATGLAGMDVSITYDNSLLIFKSVKTTDLTSGMSFAANTSISGKITMALAGTRGIKSGKGSLIEIVFAVIAEAKHGDESPIKFTKAGAFDEDAEDINLVTQDGKVKIMGIKGDVNGDGIVNAKDAILVLRFIVDLETLTPQQKWCADVIEDGEIKASDVIKILQMAVGQGAPMNELVASGKNVITVTFDEICGIAGDSIIVPIKADDINVLAGGDICISYDSSVLKVDSVSSNLGSLLMWNSPESGKVKIAFAGVKRHTNNTLATIKFDVIADNMSPLKFESINLYNINADPLSLKIVDGRFKSWALPAERSALLQNFPNPFNPETWIPYQLKQDSNVKIMIFAENGQLVRTLNLGYKQAGYYIDKNRSAYWDGKNESGELVHSGVYFYSINTSDFHATKKMILKK